MIESQEKKFFCTRPFKNATISSSGNSVFPCCEGWAHYPFGNFYQESFEEIWNGEKAKIFRRSILDGSYKFCNLKQCIDFGKAYMFYTEDEIQENFKEIMQPPELVDFKHEQICNVRCVMCRDCKKDHSAKEILELNAKIESVFLPMVSHAKFVMINGNGEALASKHCRTLIKVIAEKYPHIKFTLRSNGLLCNEKNFTALGIMDRIEYIVISLHATTKETYSKIVLDSDFDTILKNIEWLAGLKKSGKIGGLGLVSVVSVLNYKEMIDFAKFAKKHDAIVTFIEHQNFGTKIDKERNMMVYKKYHPEYNKFVKIFEDDIFKEKFVILPPAFKNLKPISLFTWLKYRIEYRIKRLFRKKQWY